MSIQSKPTDDNSSNSEATSDAPKLSFSTIESDIQSGAKLLDVRTAEEFAAGHFAGATNWPLQNLMDGKLPNVPKDTKIYVHCRTGVRSAQAAQILTNNGFTNVVDLHGLTDIENIGGELITSADA